MQRVELTDEGARVVHVVTDDESAAGCPSCGVLSTSVKGHAVTRPRDAPYGQAPLRLVWHKRRWRCLERACPRGSFTESLPAVPPRARVTTRLRSECGAGMAGRFACVKACAQYYAVSWPVAYAAFVAHVDPLLAEPLPPVQVLGIDETRRGKVKWGQDPDTGRWVVVADRWHTGIVDAAGPGGLLAHIDGRSRRFVVALGRGPMRFSRPLAARPRGAVPPGDGVTVQRRGPPANPAASGGTRSSLAGGAGPRCLEGGRYRHRASPLRLAQGAEYPS